MLDACFFRDASVAADDPPGVMGGQRSQNRTHRTARDPAIRSRDPSWLVPPESGATYSSSLRERLPAQLAVLDPQGAFSHYDIHVEQVPEIYRTARAHGIADADTLHAIGHALVIVEQHDERDLYIGPDRAGNLLEVVTVRRVRRRALVIQSMRMTTQYEPLLRGLEEDDG